MEKQKQDYSYARKLTLGLFSICVVALLIIWLVPEKYTLGGFLAPIFMVIGFLSTFGAHAIKLRRKSK